MQTWASCCPLFQPNNGSGEGFFHALGSPETAHDERNMSLCQPELTGNGHLEAAIYPRAPRELDSGKILSR